MSKWREAKLGEIIISANTGLDAIKRAPIVSYDSGIKCLRIQDISQKKDFNDWGFCEVNQTNFNKFSLKKGDIIIARTGATVGVNLFINNDLKAVFNNGLIRLKIDDKVANNKFIYFNLCSNSYKGHIEAISGGTSTQPNMQINALIDFDISLPPIEEQKVIAEILSSLEDKVALLSRQNKTLEAMAETIFRQWFLEQPEENGETCVLGDILDLNYGKGLKDDIRTGEGYPVVGSSGIVGFHSEYLVDGPGIVIGRKGTLGKVIYLYENFYPIDTTYYIKSKLSSNELFYEYFLLKTMNFKEMNSDSAVPGLNRDLALSTETQIPSIERYIKFNEVCSTFFKKTNININQICSLEKTRDLLIPKLMNGEVSIEI